MVKYKVLNIITGGLKNDGITNAWMSFCKEFNKSTSPIPFRMDFVNIETESSEDVIRTFHENGYLTPTLPSRYKKPIRYALALYGLLKNGNYDILHINGSSAFLILELLIGWFAKTKVRIAHSRNTMCNHKNIHLLLKAPFNWLCNGRIACGKDAGKWLFGNRKFEIIHNGKDLTRFSYQPDCRVKVRKQLNLNDKFVIGHVGRFNNQKNHRFLIEVFEKVKNCIPNSKLLLIGTGELEREIKELVVSKSLKDKVMFVGAVDNVPDFLQATDIMVFPSKYEGLPNVVLEWQAMGLPSIISDKITRECIVCDFIRMESIDGNVNGWVNSIMDFYKKYPNRQKNAEKGRNALKVIGFDI